MISTVFFALPSVAEFFYPNRKLVRDMMHQEILDFITTTNPAEDWVAFTRKWMSERFLKEYASGQVIYPALKSQDMVCT